MSAEAHESAPSTRRALVVRGGWPGHQPVETTDAILPFLRSNGFEVRVEDGPAIYADDDYMKTVDLIVQSVTMSTIEAAEVAGLRRAVESGTGLAGWHGGIADSFRNSADYLQLVGGQFASHPGKHPDEQSGVATDNFRPHTITILPAAAAHPITEGIDDFELVTEQYWVLHDDYNDVLAVTTQDARGFDAWTRPVTSPAVWTRQWGAGRVFVLTPGHSLEVVTHPSVRTLIERGLLWASR
jgi:type 1 glutamine amidotransferase